MRLIARFFSLLFVISSLSGCAGMITGATPYGAGSGRLMRAPSKIQSTSLYMPLNFVLRSDQGYDLRKHAKELTDDRVQEFISIGIRAFSNELGVDATRWEVKIQQDINPEPESDFAALVLRKPSRQIPLDYKVVCKFNSPQTRVLSLSKASVGQKKLIMIDRDASRNFEYRMAVTGTMSARMRSNATDAIFFDIDMYVVIERKSEFADGKHFRSFKSVDHDELAGFRWYVSELVLEAYASTLSQYGLNVQRRK